ncbi:MAG: ATP-dependent helicase [bacterium]
MTTGRTKFAPELNEKQLEGVLAIEGPVLVLAGAGSGKTRLLTYKIAHIIMEAGIDPGSILGVTFTNKAAGEMKERVKKLCGDSLKGIWLGTFHSICGRILRRDGHLVGLKENYSIYDADDQKRLMRDIMSDAGLDTKSQSPKSILGWISNKKNGLYDAETYLSGAIAQKEKTYAGLWVAYQNALRSNNAVDFDDMINLTVKLLREHLDVRDFYRNKFQYLLVDEFQDTNRAQYEFVKLLTGPNTNITVVGDDDQSIYGWRGADVRNILEFPGDHKETTVIRLERNYRSTANILKAASCVVAHNKSRHEKSLWTEDLPGDSISLWAVPDEYAEAKVIAESIKGELDNDIPGCEIAILYRVNAHSRLLEDALRKANIPHVIVGGIRFYERAEIKDILAYLKLIHNPDDDLSFKRIINMPRRGVGVKSMAGLQEIANANHMSLYSATMNADLSDFYSKSKEGFAQFANLMEHLFMFAKEKDVGELIGEVARKSGYIEMLKEDGGVEARARLDNISELINSGIEFANTHPEDPSLTAYLAETALISDIDQYEEDEESVSLMTVHSAKGLEFDVVYICGLEDGLFPIARAMESQEELEEERRLFYVAVTRARKKVHLLYAGMRHRFGEEMTGIQSRFIDEVPKNLMTTEQEIRRERHREEAPRLTPSRGKRAEKAGAISPGTVVEHPFFGRGEVRAMKGWGDNAVLTIAFPKYGIKKVLMKYADLSIVRN